MKIKFTEMFQNTDADGMNLALDRYAIKCIDNAPTIDAVEVVRCKDCKRRQEDTIFHKLYCDGREVVADGFCEKGERDE